MQGDGWLNSIYSTNRKKFKFGGPAQQKLIKNCKLIED